MDLVQACPKCSEIVVKSLRGEVKLRGKVVILRDNHCVVVCKGCNTEVAIPLVVDQEALTKSLAPYPLYINKTKDKY